MFKDLCIVVREHPAIPLVITLSSVIKNLVRKSTGGTLNLGRDEEMEGVDGGVAGTQTKAGRHTKLGFFLKESSLVFSKLLHHTFNLRPKCPNDPNSMVLPKSSHFSFITVHLTNDYLAAEPRFQCYQPGVLNPRTPGFQMLCSSFYSHPFSLKPGSFVGLPLCELLEGFVHLCTFNGSPVPSTLWVLNRCFQN